MIALAEEYPECREQRRWFHKTASILDTMPKSVQPDAKKLIHEMYMVPREDDALGAYDDFLRTYESRYPNAVRCLARDRDVLLTFHGFPAEHCIHLRNDQSRGIDIHDRAASNPEDEGMRVTRGDPEHGVSTGQGCCGTVEAYQRSRVAGRGDHRC